MRLMFHCRRVMPVGGCCRVPRRAERLARRIWAVAAWLLAPSFSAPLAAAPPLLVARGNPVLVNCSKGILLRQTLTLPRAARAHTARLVPGVIWIGSHRVAAADTQGVLRWRFTHAPVTRATITASSDGEQPLGLFGSGQRAFVVTVGGGEKGEAPHISVVGFTPQKNSGPFRVCSSRGPFGAAGDLDGRWPSAIIPGTLKWMAILPSSAAPHDRIRIWQFGRCAFSSQSAGLFEPHNHAFSSEDGRFLGWVDGGRWVSVMAVNRAASQFRRVHLVARPGLRYGAFSAHGRRMVLVASHEGSPGAVRLILAHRDAPARERVLKLWGRADGAVSACPPVFSPSGALIAAATVRIGAHWPVGIWIISTGSFRTLYYIKLRNDFPIALAFSHRGGSLAVECWYHVLIFRATGPRPDIVQRVFHRPAWYDFWVRPRTVRLR